MSDQKTPLLVISGPSGVGKSTLLKRLFDRHETPVFGFSVSHTTRQPRKGESNGVQYHFVEREVFDKLVEENGFIEHATFSGNSYGTSIQAVKHVQEDLGRICVLDVEMNGIKSIKRLGLPAKFIFISPPSIQDLETRLRGRGTETEESLSKRLAAAEAELEFSRETGSHDIIIINDAIDRAFDELVAFIDANWDASKNAPLKSSSEVPAPVADHPTSAAEVPASSPEALVPPAADAATAPAKNDTPAPVATLEKTLALIKPDAYGTGKKVAIIDRIKEAGFTIVQEKELTMTAELAKNFYKEHDGKPFFEGLVTRMTSAPIYAIVLEKPGAIKAWRELAGPTNSEKARETAPTSIRAVFGKDGSENAVHGSDSEASADREIKIVFTDGVGEVATEAADSTPAVAPTVDDATPPPAAAATTTTTSAAGDAPVVADEAGCFANNDTDKKSKKCVIM